VINDSPQWYPAISHNRYVKSNYDQVERFRNEVENNRNKIISKKQSDRNKTPNP
jgi:hypothetical protein